MLRVEIETMGCIYKILNNINGKIYIGQTKNKPEDRWKQHCRKSGSKAELNMLIKKAIAKYGKENFTFNVLEYCNSELLNKREIYWISKYNSYYNGYNLTKGGTDGEKPLKIKEKYWNYIKTLYLIDNLSLAKIAKQFKVDKGTIKLLLNKIGVTLRLRTTHYSESYLIKLLKSGKSLRTIEKETNISRGYLSTFKKKHRI